jgi:integrase
MRQPHFQQGSLRARKRAHGPSVWEFRFRVTEDGKRKMKTHIVGTTDALTETAARAEVQPLLARINSHSANSRDASVNDVLNRFLAAEHIDEIISGKQPPGHSLKYSTAYGYRIILEKYIRPHWGAVRLEAVKPGAIQEWFNNLLVSPRYKGKIKAVLHRLFEKAMLWDYLDLERNPVSLVEIRGATRRVRRPIVLTVEQFSAVLKRLPEPHRTMVLIAQCLGLRVNEILGLKWSDLDFEKLTVQITRGIVNGRVDTVKSEYSADELPLAPLLVDALRSWRTMAPANPGEWVFANPRTSRPYNANPLQKRYLRRIGRELGFPETLGWHTFRHTYRSWLDAAGVPVGVQQRLMRHAHVSTTMNVYGNALMESKRDAQQRIVGMLVPS